MSLMMILLIGFQAGDSQREAGMSASLLADRVSGNHPVKVIPAGRA
jgi:hypothetical protein